jgi:hypothetical protein
MNTNVFKRNSTRILYAYSSLLAMLISFSSSAQETEFITVVDSKKIKMSKSLIDYELKTKANEMISKLDYVKIGSLAKVQKKGILSFSIPGQSKKVTATATFVEYFSESKYKWYGKTDNGLGDVIVLCDSGKISAHISYLLASMKYILHLKAIIFLAQLTV